MVIVEGEGAVWDEFAASHCNQWGLCCIVVWKYIQRSKCTKGIFDRSKFKVVRDISPTISGWLLVFHSVYVTQFMLDVCSEKAVLSTFPTGVWFGITPSPEKFLNSGP